MTKEIGKLKWWLYLLKRNLLFYKGIKSGLIHSYEKKLIENLRHVYYGGVPASVMLLSTRLCNGHCYDRALLITLGFEDDDFRLVDADIDGILLNPEYADDSKNNKHFANHCFVERKKKDGSVWVYDTSLGLVFDRDLYYQMEKPRITKVNDKQAVLDYCEYQDIKNADIENDKYALPIILPNIEAVAEVDDGIYCDVLKNELELFKQEIGYDSICNEVNEDMMRMGLIRK